MSGKIEISRELAEHWLTYMRASDSPQLAIWANLLGSAIAAPVVEHQEPAGWSSEKPSTTGAYWIRGFNLSGEFNQSALVQVVLDEDAQVLITNLHQSTTETDTGYWYEVDDINEDFEWLGPLYAAPVAVVLPERKPIPDQATFNGGNAYYAKCFDEALSWNACIDKVEVLNQGVNAISSTGIHGCSGDLSTTWFCDLCKLEQTTEGNCYLCSGETRPITQHSGDPLPPFAQRVIRKLRRFEECASDGQGADIGRHWFDLLTQLGLLNRVQRSPALWEMTQQGEDLLKVPARH